MFGKDNINSPDTPMARQSKSQNTPLSKRDWKSIRSFLSEIKRDVSFSARQLDINSFWFIREGEFISLSPKGYEKYLRVKEKILNKFSKNDLSESAIDNVLETAVFESVNIPENGEEDSSTLVNKALDKLKEFLARPPEEYELWIEISGLDADSLPDCFGEIRFVVFDADQRDYIKTKNAENQQGKTADTEYFFPKFSSDNPVTAVVKVKARDRKAAEELAERKLRTTLECLNFFQNLTSNKCQSLSIGPKQPDSSTKLITSCPDGRMHMSKIADYRPSVLFSIKKLRSDADGMISAVLDRVENLLREDIAKNSVKKLLLTSVCLAGKASVEKVREKSFLMFMIALESLVLPMKNPELNYRLSQRAAWLLGGNLYERQNLKKLIKGLYDTRSEIVHSGYYEISEAEHQKASKIVKISILKLLTNQDIENFQKRNQLEAWLEKLTLGFDE